MKKWAKEKLNLDLSTVLNRRNTETDSPLSLRLRNITEDDAETSSTHSPTSMLFVIEELRKTASQTIPPNKTMVKSDFIPFPPDWNGPVPACQKHLYRKNRNIFSRALSFLRGKRSSSGSSTEPAQTSHMPIPPLTEANPVHTAMGTTPMALPSEQAIVPSTSEFVGGRDLDGRQQNSS